MVGEMNNQQFQPSVSKMGGLDAKFAILIAYFGAAILGFIPVIQYVAWLLPLIIYFIDKDNKFIAFHAIQAFLLEVFVAIISIIYGFVVVAVAAGSVTSAIAFGGAGAIGGIIAVTVLSILVVVVAILALILAILAAIKGYRYQIYEIVLVGKWAERIVFKTA